MKRIVVLLTRMERVDEVVAAAAKKSKRLGAGVTLLYVREERLFELPVFSRREPSPEAIREHLIEQIRHTGGEDWAVLVFDDDPVDRLLLEAEREHAVLIISDLTGEERAVLIDRAAIPLWLLEPETRHDCPRALLIVDPAYMGDCGLSEIRRIVDAGEWRAYMDYQIVPTMGTDLSMDPMLDTLNLDVAIDTEVMEARKKAFEECCKSEGIPARFEVGELGIVGDILVHAEQEAAECLVLMVEDRQTLLAGALAELAQKAGRDLLIYYRDFCTEQ